MPDVQEVFRMATQKVRPDPGALDRQLSGQRARSVRRKVGAYAVVAAILGIAAIVAVNSLPDRRSTDVGTDPRLPATTRSGRFFLDLETGATRPLPVRIPQGTFYAIHADGTMVATSACCDGSDPVLVANVDGTEVRQITEGEMDGYGPRWCPDPLCGGSTLVFQGKDGSTSELGDLFVVDVGTGDRTRITNLGPKSYDPWFLSPSFAPDGQSILFQLPRGADRVPAGWDLWSVPSAGGEPTLVRRDASMGAYSVDGSLAYVDPSGGDWSSDILLVADGSGPGRVVAHGDEIAFPRWSPDGTRIAYVDAGAVYVLDVATGATSHVADGGWGEWFDADTLVISPD